MVGEQSALGLFRAHRTQAESGSFIPMLFFGEWSVRVREVGQKKLSGVSQCGLPTSKSPLLPVAVETLTDYLLSFAFSHRKWKS